MLQTPVLKVGVRPKFQTRPGQALIADFINHLKNTGKPDTWEHHTPTPPPANADFEILLEDFEVPKKFHDVVGKASCPICSPLAPKYFRGFLAWFPAEGVIRAIGHECAKRHFGASALAVAHAQETARLRRTKAEEYLIETYPRVKAITDEVLKVLPRVKLVELMHKKFWGACSRTAARALLKQVKGAYLPIYQDLQTNTIDRFGQSKEARTQEEIERIPFVGSGFLSWKTSISAHATNTISALRQIESRSDDEALDFVANRLFRDDYLYQAETLVRGATDAAQLLFNHLDDTSSFFSRANLANLSRWSSHTNLSAPVMFRYDNSNPNEVFVRGQNKPWTRIPLDQFRG